MRAVVVVVTLALVLLTADRAGADCAPFAWVSGAPGGHVPQRGTLFVHGAAPDLAWRDSTAKISQPAPGVVRIDYDARSADTLPIRRARFAPSRDWHPPAAAPQVRDIRHTHGEWTCSSWDTVVVEIDQAVAGFRLRWTFGDATREWFEAARLDDDASGSTLALGKRNCGDRLLDPDELHVGGHLELFAIRFDGTEVPVLGVPDDFAFPHAPYRVVWILLATAGILAAMYAISAGQLRRTA